MVLPVIFARALATVAAASVGQKVTGSLSIAGSLAYVTYSIMSTDNPKKTWKKEWSPGQVRGHK